MELCGIRCWVLVPPAFPNRKCDTFSDTYTHLTKLFFCKIYVNGDDADDEKNTEMFTLL
jgi:hypothetical protein